MLMAHPGVMLLVRHSTNNSMIRTTRSLPKNIKFGVQRESMIAIYYALKDNIEVLSGTRSGKKKIRIDVRSYSRLQLKYYKSESQELETKNRS